MAAGPNTKNCLIGSSNYVVPVKSNITVSGNVKNIGMKAPKNGSNMTFILKFILFRTNAVTSKVNMGVNIIKNNSM